MRFEGRCALVTGAGIGIGREVALELAREGADVVLSYSRSAAGAESAAEEIRAMGRRATAIGADLSRVEECARLVDEAAATLGQLDILVNNAGMTAGTPFLDVTPDEYDHLFDLNMRGQFFCAQRAAQIMRDQAPAGAARGVIINMLSIHALAGSLPYTVYDGTKGAIMAWTRTVAAELAPLGIRVVGVAPGAIEVPRFFDRPGYTSEGMGARIPWGRVGQPIDIARVCSFLASDDADFMVGSIVVVDGGTLTLMKL